MTTYITLQFNDGEINLSTSSFLFKQSKLLQSIDLEEDNNIPILCSRSYVTNKHKKFFFNNKINLLFMFTLSPDKFLDVCKFLDIICYENNDTSYSTQFITYVMKNIKEEINIIKYFMQDEIRSIMNYLNKECIDLQIKSCTPAFYALYLTEYKEKVIKYNRIDIYELSTDKIEYYRYIHKYDNHLTYFVKETHEYKDYTVNISKQLNIESKRSNNINNIKELVEQGANINFQNGYGYTALHCASNKRNNLKVIRYLIEQGANINLQNKHGYTALHIASDKIDNLKVIKYLVEHGANVNLQDNLGNIALHFASDKMNNLKVIRYLVEQGTDVNLQSNNGQTALHFASCQSNNFRVIKYLVEQGADVNLQNNKGYTALPYVCTRKNNLEVVKYLVEQGANVNLQNNDGYTALHYVLQIGINEEVINYLKQFN